MKILKEEYLEKATPYMIRNDGKVFKCGIVHPYLNKGLPAFPSERQFVNYTFGLLIDLDESNLYWFYKHTKSHKTKDEIKKFVVDCIDLFKDDKEFVDSNVKESLIELYGISKMESENLKTIELLSIFLSLNN